VVKAIRESSPFTPPRLFDSAAVVNEMDKILRLQYLTDFAHRQGLAQNRDVVESVRRLRENLLLRRVQKKQVDEVVEATEDEVRAYYDTHRHLYNFPAQKKVREIQVSNLDRAFEIARRAKKGEKFQKLAHQYNERETTKRQDGLLGFISAGVYGAVGSTAAGMKIGEIGGPVELAGKYSVFQVLDAKEPQPLSYAQGRDRAKRELFAEKKKAREAEWNKMLRDRHPVTVYEDVLQKAFQKRI
jgi:parvulin-like peptidyl-prolyl isomerase